MSIRRVFWLKIACRTDFSFLKSPNLIIFKNGVWCRSRWGMFHNVQDLKAPIWGLLTLKYACMPDLASYLTQTPNMGVKSPYGGLRHVTCKWGKNWKILETADFQQRGYPRSRFVHVPQCSGFERTYMGSSNPEVCKHVRSCFLPHSHAEFGGKITLWRPYDCNL